MLSFSLFLLLQLLHKFEQLFHSIFTQTLFNNVIIYEVQIQLGFPHILEISD